MIKVLIALKKRANQNNRKGVPRWTGGWSTGLEWSSNLYRLIQRYVTKRLNSPPFMNCSKCFLEWEKFSTMLLPSGLDQAFFCFTETANRLQIMTGITDRFDLIISLIFVVYWLLNLAVKEF